MTTRLQHALIANAPEPWTSGIAAALADCGYGVEVAQGLPDDVHAHLADVVLLGRGDDDADTLDAVRRLARDVARPVVVVLPEPDAAFVHEAAEQGAFGYLVGTNAAEVQSVVDVALQRFAQYQGLQDAFEGRAVVERAKGILMERQGIGEEEAFALLREHARSNSRRLVDVALSVIESHNLLSRGA